MAEPLLSVTGLDVAFVTSGVRQEVLHSVSFVLEAGRSYGLVGESGSGKTVLAMSLGQLLPQVSQRGSIRLKGQEMIGQGDTVLRSIRGARIGFVFQEPMTSLNPVLTIAQQIEEVLIAHEVVNRRQVKSRCRELLREVGITDAERRAAAYPHQLSGGLRQRAMLAMALAAEPELLVADEPTTALDVTIQAQILHLIRELCRRRQMTLLLVTHDLPVVAQVCDRVLVIAAGRLVEAGPCDEVFSSPAHAATRSLRKAQPSLTPKPAGEGGIGSPGAALLELRDVSCSFDVGRRSLFGSRADQRLLALRHVDISLPVETSLGVVGESGCGKSTLARILAGLITPDQGSVRYRGKVRRAGVRDPAFHREVQMIFQDPLSSLNPKFTVLEAVAEGLAIHRIGTRLEQRRQVQEALQRVGLPAAVEQRFPHQLSGGQRQRVTLARALVMRPKVLICDEAVASLDGPLRLQILQLLHDLKAQEALTLIMISHDLSVIADLCHQLAVMYLGEIVEQGATQAVFERPRHPYTEALLRSVPRFGQPIEALKGEVASSLARPGGCPFHPRCDRAEPQCMEHPPGLEQAAGHHLTRCLLEQTSQRPA